MNYDVVVIGGGPVGLSAASFCAQRGLSTVVVEARKMGGQLVSLYPSKTVYDYPGYLAIEARELGERFVEQARESGCEMKDGEEVNDLHREGGDLVVGTSKGTYRAKAVILALGMGSGDPRLLQIPGELELQGKGVHHAVLDRHEFEGQRVLVVGGGDSALESALTLVAVAKRVTLVHRREEFRAMEKNVEALKRSPAEVLPNTEVARILGEDHVQGCVLFNNTTGEEQVRDFDEVVIQIGLSPAVRTLRDWGLGLVGPYLKVDADMSTSMAGVFACGDIVTYDGKDQRLSSGLGEAAATAISVYKYLRRPYWA